MPDPLTSYALVQERLAWVRKNHPNRQAEIAWLVKLLKLIWEEGG